VHAAAVTNSLCTSHRPNLGDCHNPVQDLLKQGYQGRNIVLLGDSAGGGMVPAVAIQLQCEGITLPAALGMFSPYSDLRSLGDSARCMIAVDPGRDRLSLGTAASTGGEMEGLAAVYLGNNASNLNDPLASPVEADYGGRNVTRRHIRHTSMALPTGIAPAETLRWGKPRPPSVV
jgi:acetyl esterase/lipase